MTGCYRPGLDRLGLTYPQYLVVLVLQERGSLTVSELEERLQLSNGTLSPLLGRLESSGLLDRRRRADDERIVQLSLTEAGLGLRQDIAGIRADMRRASGLAVEEITELVSRVNTLTARLRVERVSDAADGITNGEPA